MKQGKKKAAASERSATTRIDLITQQISTQGHKDVAQICLWIKELYELDSTELRCAVWGRMMDRGRCCWSSQHRVLVTHSTCLELLDKLVLKSPNNHLPYRLKVFGVLMDKQYT